MNLEGENSVAPGCSMVSFVRNYLEQLAKEAASFAEGGHVGVCACKNSNTICQVPSVCLALAPLSFCLHLLCKKETDEIAPVCCCMTKKYFPLAQQCERKEKDSFLQP